MEIIGFIIVGAVAGFLARLIVPGRDPMGILATILLGIVGAFLGGFLADALFDAGYTLHVDAAVEDMRDSPNEVAVPLTTAGAKTPVRGRRYVSSLAYSF